MGFLSKLFKTEKKALKGIEGRAAEVEAYAETMANLTDSELQAKTPYFKELLANGKTLEDILPEAFAVCREAAKRVLGEYPYHVQVLGAIALHQGDVAEMKTGEGKTLTSTMCIYLNALTGKGVHIVTVNEYLAKRDSEWMGRIYKFLGLSVGYNARELTPQQKRDAYKCDITYTTNSELGFDYLRDNMLQSMEARVLRGLYMAVIDECDSILIDESRTPLIISGGQKQTANLYVEADRFAKTLEIETHFNIDKESKAITLTDAGVKKAEEMFKLDNLYRLEYTALVHHIHQALKANFSMQKDVDYMVADGEIVIVDQFTGRQLKGRTFSDGLHQAIEAKEGVKIKQETSVLATITYQNFFRLYEKLGGMTGTAKTEEEEFLETYNMRVVVIPTHNPIQRIDAPDFIYATKAYKYKAMVEEIKERHEKGQPILVGTISVETSEVVSDILHKAGLKHEVLNAKNHAREAEIIKKAGERNSITIATNMAGRGTDIKLGEGVRELGGLAVIGTERHESRRIDNQLRGRSGRQGDPGYSRFYVSMEDDLMQRFGNNNLMKSLFAKLGDQCIENATVTNAISNAQMRVEGYNFDIRKNLLGYDDVLRQQREIMYAQRDKVLSVEDAHDIVVDLMNRVAIDNVKRVIYYDNKEPMVDGEKLLANLEAKKLPVDAILVEEVDGPRVDEAINTITDNLAKSFEVKRKIWGEHVFRTVERQILIKIIDMNWTNHIDRMAKLRDGISLRSYANTNPLQSYINEGYQMFEDMKLKIAEDVTNYCLHANVRIERRPAPTQQKPAQ